MSVLATKCCRQCKRALSIVHSFYDNSRGGRMSICKECHKANVRENRELKSEYYRAKNRQRDELPHRREQRRAYQQTPRGTAAHLAACARYRRWKVLEQQQVSLQHLRIPQ